MDETMEVKSKVYVQTDARGRITRCEGGYTMGNIAAPEDWTLIDEGAGDRYNLCQSHYFEGGLRTRDGLARYKLEGGVAVLRSEEELAADRAALPAPGPTEAQRLEAQVTYTAMMTDTLLEV